MTLNKKIILTVILFVAVALGYLRDSVFVSINERTGQGPSGTGALFFWKWPLTFAFAFAYFLLTCIVIRFIFHEKKYIYLAAVIYFLLCFIALLAAGSGYVIYSFEKVYPFVRTIMGIAQSPVVLLILLPFCYVNEKLSVNKKMP